MTAKGTKRTIKPVDPQQEQNKKIIYLLEIIAAKLGDCSDKLEFLCDDARRNQ